MDYSNNPFKKQAPTKSKRELEKDRLANLMSNAHSNP